jgi:Tfp pilus assembly protein PilF
MTMRAIAMALLLATGPAVAATGGDTVAPKSVQLTQQGQAALAAKHNEQAIDLFETALVVDPKNGDAFIGIAKAYEAQGLPGKAVRYYREALELDPNDIAALEGQGLALVQRGASARANVNLERIKALCKTDCAAAARLQSAMNAAKAAPKTASAEAVKPPVPAAKN